MKSSATYVNQIMTHIDLAWAIHVLSGTASLLDAFQALHIQ